MVRNCQYYLHILLKKNYIKNNKEQKLKFEIKILQFIYEIVLNLVLLLVLDSCFTFNLIIEIFLVILSLFLFISILLLIFISDLIDL